MHESEVLFSLRLRVLRQVAIFFGVFLGVELKRNQKVCRYIVAVPDRDRLAEESGALMPGDKRILSRRNVEFDIDRCGRAARTSGWA